jgi:hypothetical protein
MFANVNDFRKNNFFPVFGCILKNSLKSILQCLEQRKMKKKKNQKPQSTGNPPQTTIKQLTNPPSQQNPLHQNQEQTNNKQIKTHKSSQS